MCYTVSLLIKMTVTSFIIIWFVIMVIVSSVITPKYFHKIKRKNSKNKNFEFFSYERETLTFLGTGLRKETKSK